MDPFEMLKALAVETRVGIIDLLKSEGPLGAKRLAELLGITPSAVSQHLKVLRQAGLVKSQRRGYWIPYSVDERALENCRQVVNKVCTCGCGDTCRRREADSASLEWLKKREQELQQELTATRARIAEMERAGKTPDT